MVKKPFKFYTRGWTIINSQKCKIVHYESRQIQNVTLFWKCMVGSMTNSLCYSSRNIIKKIHLDVDKLCLIRLTIVVHCPYRLYQMH